MKLKPRETVEVFLHIVVAGGWYNGYLSQSEIYNTATRVWRDGPHLPEPIFYSSSLQHEDTFLLMGGISSVNGHLDTIYQYNQISETWILGPERLSTPKGYFDAVLAGPPVADCS